MKFAMLFCLAIGLATSLILIGFEIWRLIFGTDGRTFIVAAGVEMMVCFATCICMTLGMKNEYF